VNKVEFSGVLESFRDVQIFGDLGIDPVIFLVPMLDYGMQAGAGDGISRGE
jgi:hypothetical protein